MNVHNITELPDAQARRSPVKTDGQRRRRCYGTVNKLANWRQCDRRTAASKPVRSEPRERSAVQYEFVRLTTRGNIWHKTLHDR